MTDRVSREVRSRIMAGIQGGRRNRLELRVHGWLCGSHVRHRMWPGMMLVGGVRMSPDARLVRERVSLVSEVVYLFVNGCMWHGCPQHYREPKSNSPYWRAHIAANAARDLRQRAALDAAGVPWLAVWEHEVRDGSYRARVLEAVGRTAA